MNDGILPSTMTDEHLVTVRPPVWALILAVIIAGSFYLAGKNMERSSVETGTLTVSGEGKVSSPPTIAELSFGVQTGPQKTAKMAMDMLTEDMNAIIAAVKAQGIEDKDIRTQSLSMNPSYDWTSGRQILRGYEANQSLTVKVRDLDKSGDVLTAATNAGANQAGGVNFTIDEPEAVREEARKEAIAQAKEKAEKLADDLGATLGKLRSFSEGGDGMMPPMPYYSRMEMGVGGAMDEAAKSVPVPTGEQEIRVTVSLTYELE